MRKDGNEFTPAKDLPKYETQVFSRVTEYCNNKQRPTIIVAAEELASCLGHNKYLSPLRRRRWARTAYIYIVASKKIQLHHKLGCGIPLGNY